MPDPSDREERMRAVVEADIRERFLPHGDCRTIGLETVTLWIPPRDHAGAECFAARRSEEDYASYGDREPAIRAADELIRSLRPERPHWFLDTIATEPALFGRGLAGRLLEHDLAARDAVGEPCALDTHTPRQVAFYERHGFEVVGRGEPAPGFPIVVMLREPRGH
jgi:GNAT superfamily N-acetyltransferase